MDLKRDTIDSFEGDQDRANVFLDRYAMKSEEGHLLETTWDQTVSRIVGVYKDRKVDIDYSKLEDLLKNFKFIPGGRILSGLGVSDALTLYNCLVLKRAEDDLDDIYRLNHELARSHKSGSGVGFRVDSLRPRGSYLTKSRGHASGPVTFMHVHNTSADVISQGGCFTSDTKVRLLDGRRMSFKELVESGMDQFWVYSYDVKNRKYVPGLAHSPRLTKRSSKLVEITLDNGEKIRCTPDHKFLMRNGVYREAQYLGEGNSLMPLRTIVDKHGYERIVLDDEDGTRSYTRTHWMVVDSLYSDNIISDIKSRVKDIHHSNELKLDNDPERNLMILDHDVHYSLHALRTSERNKDPEFIKRSAKTRSKIMKRKYVNNENGFRDHIYAKNRKGNKIVTERRHRTQFVTFGMQNSVIVSERNKINWEDSEYREKMLDVLSSNGIKVGEQLNVCDLCGASIKGNFAFHSHRMSHRPGYYHKVAKKRNETKASRIHEKLLELGLDISKDNWVHVGVNVLGYRRNLVPKFDKFQSMYNHKVVSVRHLDYTEDVYDITVDRWHNFALDSGVIVHNSRRGATLINMSVHHPDILEFIHSKDDGKSLYNMNISVMLSDEFIHAVKNNLNTELRFPVPDDIYANGNPPKQSKSIPAVQLWNDFVNSAWTSGDPCLQNHDLVCRTTSHHYLGYPVESYNACCFTGDTKISLLDGRELSFEDLVKEFGDGRKFHLYSYNHDSGRIDVGEAHSPRMVRKVSRLARVTLDNGESVRCTLDHKWMLRDGTYKEAQYLRPGDSLMPLYRDLCENINPKHRLKGYEMLRQPNGFWEFTHHVVDAWDGMSHDLQYDGGVKVVIHHRNVNKRKMLRDESGRFFNHEVTSVEFLEGDFPVYDITVDKHHNFALTAGVFVHNSEIPLPSYGVCLLGALNLSKFVSDSGQFESTEFMSAVRTSVRFLDAIIEMGQYPLIQCEDVQKSIRKIGLGVMGLGHMFTLMNVSYGSQDSIDICHQLFTMMRDTAFDESIELAKEQGAFPAFGDGFFESEYVKKLPQDILDKIRKHGIRNSTLLSAQPTGTTSLLVGTTSGIEPAFARQMVRKDRLGTRVMEDASWADAKRLGFTDSFKTAHDIDPYDRVNVQSVVQMYIDQAISSTVNLPNHAKPDDVSGIFGYALEKGIKTISVFRDGSKEGVLSSSDDSPKKSPKVTPGVELESNLRETSESEQVSRQKVDKRLETLIDISEVFKDGTPFILPSVRYKIQYSQNASLYISISYVTSKTKRLPVEIFIHAKKSDHTSWSTAVGISCSMYLQNGGDPIELIRKLKAVQDPNGGVRMVIDNRSVHVPSGAAAIGVALEHFLNGDVEVPIEDAYCLNCD